MLLPAAPPANPNEAPTSRAISRTTLAPIRTGIIIGYANLDIFSKAILRRFSLAGESRGLSDFA